jgi:glucokinase
LSDPAVTMGHAAPVAALTLVARDGLFLRRSVLPRLHKRWLLRINLAEQERA